ncbi:site-specific DNA-methyltransferase [Macellibacteroides fermentans]|uniref:site-specific DNA-methyltransferase n=1 Tax=Macellibacteroides fermentans TaxID=879969 RepID=UPI00406C70D1
MLYKSAGNYHFNLKQKTKYMQKTNIPQAESKSADLVAQNLEQLKQIFPEVIKEGRVDFEALNDLLGNYGDTAEERFCLNWAGKANARREAQKRSTGTLRPCPEESVDWDTTDNLYIEGDNLEVLKLLQKSYHSRVKMIYIDPPYNTGKDFLYKDNYADNMKNYLELTGQDKKLSTNTESDGRYHSNWLNMMYPRLKLARNLLTDDGVIFISIDDNEVANLRKVCDEIFGEENFVTKVVINRTSEIATALTIQKTEYCLVFAKNHLNIKIVGNKKHTISRGTVGNIDQTMPEITFPKGLKCINVPDGIYSATRKIDGSRENIENLTPIIVENSKLKNDIILKARWRSSNDMRNFFANNCMPTEAKINGVIEEIYFDGDRFVPQIKKLTTEKLSSLYLDNKRGSKDLEEVRLPYFEFPKSKFLIFDFISLFAEQGDVILDFFSGSATTAHAVMQLNAEDGGNRKYICVQIPEPTPEESEARKAGYATIPEIAKERIRRAGKKIVEEQKAKAEKEGGLFAEEEKKLDIGFKVFKLDSSNINAWDSDPDNLETALNNSLFNIKTDRSEDDLLYEILIKYGIELTEKINRHTIDGKTVYEMGAGSLIVCLADSLSTAVADGIGKLYKEVSPEGVDANCRVVFKEAGFNGSDEVKTNTLLILKQHGITNVATV